MNHTDDIKRLLVDHIPDLLLAADGQGTVRYASPSFYTTTGIRPEALVGQSYFSGLAEEDVDDVRRIWPSLVQGAPPTTLEYRCKTASGGLLWIESKLTAVEEGNEPKLILIASRDLSSRKKAEEELQHLAYYDPLTGLANRRLFHDRYKQALLSAKRYGHRLALLYLDLDDFKSINDTYGHAIGDMILKIVSARLINCIRDPDTICRLGGDEFIVLLQQFDEESDVEKIAKRMIESLSRLIHIQDHEIRVTCSMGASLYPEDSANGDTLIQMADAAMYMAKHQGKDHFFLYRKN
ncbi:sensor domain-containing diguanylate cyclase [Paenibacillus hamazuiensis]|uniref:sensor domain-containing diguanylate cyclase n=1 Tax=Paenibacillus hamazuiensis TaxID=2936508 RepID=UPI00200E7621|nr:sensor domain-containing diguanylate cyclase [Paenibacillus hamazuiensis]